MLVKDIVNPNVSPIKDILTVKEALIVLLEKHYNGVVVVDGREKLVGILSLQDIAAAIVPDEMKQNANLADALYQTGFFQDQCQMISKKKVYEVMRKEFITVTPETSVMTVAADFLKNDLYLVPVIDGTKLVGIITRSEIKKALANGMNILPSSK